MRDANLITTVKTSLQFFAFIFAMMGQSLVVKAGPSTVSSLTSVGPDIVLLILPQGGKSTRIGLAYNKRIPHDRVRADVRRISDLSGWAAAADLVIADASLQPNRTKEYPVTTTAMFTLVNAPQVVNYSPVLLPYMRAFQEWNNIEILFHLPEMNPFRGPEHVDSEFYTLQLNKTQGVYRYEIQIKDHKGAFPEPLELIRAAHPAFAPKPAADNKTASANIINIPLALIIVGSLLSGGVGIWLLYSRRAITIHER